MEHFGVAPGRQTRYEYLLSPIGAYLDSLDARYISIAEIEEGFIWHCFKNGHPDQCLTGAFAYDDIPRLIASVKQEKHARALAQEEALKSRKAVLGLFKRRGNVAEPAQPPHPVCPLGYEETLRSLGAKLEEERAYCVLLFERAASMLVRYSVPLPTYIRLDVSKIEMTTGFREIEYLRDDLLGIVEDARRR